MILTIYVIVAVVSFVTTIAIIIVDSSSHELRLNDLTVAILASLTPVVNIVALVLTTIALGIVIYENYGKSVIFRWGK